MLKTAPTFLLKNYKLYDTIKKTDFIPGGDGMFTRYLFVFFISMVPLIELRGAIPIAVGMGIEPIHAIVV